MNIEHCVLKIDYFTNQRFRCFCFPDYIPRKGATTQQEANIEHNVLSIETSLIHSSGLPILPEVLP